MSRAKYEYRFGGKVMQRYLKNYIVLATLLSVLWSVFTVYLYISQTDRGNVIEDEIKRHARHTSMQVLEVFNWFEAKEEVFVPLENSGIDSPASGTIIQGSNGRALAMPLPIDLVRLLENEIMNGINIRFVSNTPINSKHLPSVAANNALIKAIESGDDEFFEYREDVDRYSYVSPLKATKSCISCHQNIDVGGLIGAVVIDINSEQYLDAQRESNYKLLLANAILSFITVIIFYFFIVDIWRRQIRQTSNMQYAQAIASNMSQEIDLAINNMNHVLAQLKQDSNDPQRLAVFQSLQTINKNLLDTAFKLQAGENKSLHGNEEIFNVEDFFNQCAQIFYPECLDKQLDLSVNIDISVPSYLLGNTYYLRQAVGRLLKYSVMYTRKGSIQLRVRSAVDMPSRFHMADLNHIPIHLIIEIEDTSNGFVVTNNQNLLKSFANSAVQNNKVNTRPIISLTPVNEIAQFLDGNVVMLHNGKNGACFKLTVQMKLMNEDSSTTRLGIEHEVAKSNSMASIEQTSVKHDAAIIHDNMIHSLTSNVMTQGKNAVNLDALHSTNEKISFIIADVDSISDYAMKVWKDSNFNVRHMTTATQVLEAISKPNHGYSIVFIRSVTDTDQFYLATRIRYNELDNAKPIAVVLIGDDIVRTDMDVMRFFNISTIDNFPRDANLLVKIADLVMQTYKNKIFQNGHLLDKTYSAKNSNQLFDKDKALENTKHDKQLLRSICSMWIRFYPKQIERLRSIVEENDRDEIIRFLRSVKNSASTVSLPMLWAEANRIETKIMGSKEIRYEKLFTIYEQTYNQLKNIYEVKSNDDGA